MRLERHDAGRSDAADHWKMILFENSCPGYRRLLPVAIEPAGDAHALGMVAAETWMNPVS